MVIRRHMQGRAPVQTSKIEAAVKLAKVTRDFERIKVQVGTSTLTPVPVGRSHLDTVLVNALDQVYNNKPREKLLSHIELRWVSTSVRYGRLS